MLMITRIAKAIIPIILAAVLVLSACTPASTEPTIAPTLPATEPALPSATITLAPVATTMTPPSTVEAPEASTTPTSAPAQTQEATTAPTQANAATTETTASDPLPDREDAIIIDHTAVALFDQIPAEYLERARSLRVIYSNASVGKNLSEALDCLASASWEASPAHCRRDYTGSGGEWKAFTGGDAPARIRFPANSSTYDRSNWVFDAKPGGWQSVTDYFINTLVPQNVDRFDVLSYKFTYLMVEEQSDISDPATGFLADQPDRYDVKDLEALFAQYPDKTFFLWTSSLSRSIGSQVALDFNNQMRSYAAENGLILFDIADIESHTDAGAPCFDNRDGVKFCSNNGECEELPDDGVDLPAICQDYTTEIEGGHLGSVSSGKIQLAKAFWVLIARIAGWNP